ncbi:MAG TPA: hypothetical protein VMM15_25075 [Bradyrhizobium sp.]|nr:hypothetical protein [Bradyrhizobium sp.]
MERQNERKSLSFHPYRRHTSTPTHFPPTGPGFSRFRAELPHLMTPIAGLKPRRRKGHRAVSVAPMTRDTACLDPAANGIDRMFPL